MAREKSGGRVVMVLVLVLEWEGKALPNSFTAAKEAWNPPQRLKVLAISVRVVGRVGASRAHSRVNPPSPKEEAAGAGGAVSECLLLLPNAAAAEATAAATLEEGCCGGFEGGVEGEEEMVAPATLLPPGEVVEGCRARSVEAVFR